MTTVDSRFPITTAMFTMRINSLKASAFENQIEEQHHRAIID